MFSPVLLPLPPTAILTPAGDDRWTLSGLSSAQNDDGDYVLTLGTGVQDRATNSLVAVSERWTMDRVKPIVTIPIVIESTLDTTPELNGTVDDHDATVVGGIEDLLGPARRPDPENGEQRDPGDVDEQPFPGQGEEDHHTDQGTECTGR